MTICEGSSNRQTMSTDRIQATRRDLAFVLEVVLRQERWSNEDLDRRKKAIETLRNQIQQLDDEAGRLATIAASRTVLHRRLNIAVYAIAVLSVLHLFFRSQLALTPALAVSVVFVVAIIRTNPEGRWYRLLLATLVPIAMVVVGFGVPPLRSLLTEHKIDPVGMLGLLYAVSFAIGTGDAGTRSRVS